MQRLGWPMPGINSLAASRMAGSAKGEGNSGNSENSSSKLPKRHGFAAGRLFPLASSPSGNSGNSLADGFGAGISRACGLPCPPPDRAGVHSVTAAAGVEAVRRVLAYRRQAKLGEWVPYAKGPQLDRLNPVGALVRGWERQGLVELREGTGPEGERSQQFRRLEADFPAWWHSEPEPLPQPPSRRDPDAVGVEWMAYWAGQGDERAEWLHFAAAHYRAKLIELSAAAGEGELPADAAKLLAEAGLVMMTLEQMLHPDLPTPVRLAAVRRSPRPPGISMLQAQKEHDAAAQVERALAVGENQRSAITGAAKSHSVARGAVGRRLSNRKAWRELPAASRMVEATDLASALQAGGLLEKDALAVASELTGLAAAEIRKAMKSR